MFNIVVAGDFNTENLEIEHLPNIDTGADYTWKKAENLALRTTKIDYIFSNVTGVGSYKDMTSDHRALYFDI